jgi:4-hydroxythreonine-4-phosphate dehydrogenase
MPERVARLLITPGEPAGIGPDLLLRLAQRDAAQEWVVIADPELLRRRARQLALPIEIQAATLDSAPRPHTAGCLKVLAEPLGAPEQPGHPDPRNAAYLLDSLRLAVTACRAGQADALVTGPVQKSSIVEGGFAFTGHTEFLAELCGAARPVMLLVAGRLRVALVTTHLPLRAVPDAITAERLAEVTRIFERGLREQFGIREPRLLVCGLNPHAGESGHLGREEIEVIAPTLARLRAEGLRLEGPLPADTLFVPEHLALGDGVLAMYHDQGLPVLKHAGFHEAVNVTLGLPIVRTSVDHGTALDLAGSGRGDTGSLAAALALAAILGQQAARGRLSHSQGAPA